MQVPVQALHDVGNAEDVGHFRLRPIPLGKGIDPAQESDVRDAALSPGVERVLVRFDPGEVLADEVRGPPELVALVQKLQPVLLELDPRNAGHEHDGDNREAPQQGRAPVDDEPAQTIEGVSLSLAQRPDPQGDDRQESGEEGHRVDEGAESAERDDVAHDLERRHLREVEAQETDRGRERGKEHRPRIDLEGMRGRPAAVHSLPQTRRHSLDDVDGMRDGDRHQDEERRRALPEQPHAGPAREPQRGEHDRNHHQENRDRSPYRAQQNDGDEQHRPERDGGEDGGFLVDRVTHGTVEDELAGKVVLEGRAFLPRLGGGAGEEVGNLLLPELSILGEGDTDHQPGDPAVPGHEAPGDLLGAERGSLDPFEVVVAQRSRIGDKRLDDQLVLAAFAMRVVRDGIDAGHVRRLPELLGQLFEGAERFAREDGALLRRHGDERRIGERVGVFEPFEGDDVRVVRAEVIPDVDVDLDEVPQARGEGEHDQQGEQNGQPSPARYERNPGLKAHVANPSPDAVATISG